MDGLANGTLLYCVSMMTGAVTSERTDRLNSNNAQLSGPSGPSD